MLSGAFGLGLGVWRVPALEGVAAGGASGAGGEGFCFGGGSRVCQAWPPRWKAQRPAFAPHIPQQITSFCWGKQQDDGGQHSGGMHKTLTGSPVARPSKGGGGGGGGGKCSVLKYCAASSFWAQLHGLAGNLITCETAGIAGWS